MKAHITVLSERETLTEKQTQYLETQREVLPTRLDNELENRHSKMFAQIQAQAALMQDMNTFINACDARFQQVQNTVNTDMGHAKTAIAVASGSSGGGGNSKRSKNILDPKKSSSWTTKKAKRQTGGCSQNGAKD